MDLLMTVLLLLVCLLISSVISHYIPFIPTALTQIAFGIIIALVFKNVSVEIETEWFLLLFVAPLLYNDGRHFPNEELWKMRVPILGNAIVLVLLTTIGGGYFIYWVIPDIPLAASFALAAILSPTDPVSVNGIAKRIHIPEKVLNLVRGESLINDASGLVAFNYAVTAVVTGYFSLQKALFDFSYTFFVGAILGLVLSLLISWIEFTLRKQGINDVIFHSLLQIMTPFIIFIITEKMLHASGVIAVVVAGVVHSLRRARVEAKAAQQQLLTESLWSTVIFILNGIVFLLLGLNIPSSMDETVANPNISNWLAVGYVIAIGVSILGIRFIWSYIFSNYEYYIRRVNDCAKPSIKASLLISLTGVRGGVTMAGVLSIPYLLMSGEEFPQRSLILFLAAGVILFTLIIATVFLPLLSKVEVVEGEEKGLIDINEAKSRLLIAAIKKIKEEINEENRSAAYELINEYRVMFQNTHHEENSIEKGSSEYQQRLREVLLKALKAERKYIHDLREKNGIDEEVFKTFEKSLDHREEAISNNVLSRTRYLIGKIIRSLKDYFSRYNKNSESKATQLRLAKDIQVKVLYKVLRRLAEYAKEYERPEIVLSVILDYRKMVNRLKRSTTSYNQEIEVQKEELRIKVIDVERSEIHRMYELGEISREQVKELRRVINYIESVTLYEHVE
ncbi:Na+/H+ antiporter [Clostridium cylindrosporum]|uniref:Sodium, potassium, lithium and rubidium/H(+) antiporter NhaK n=1 Tax=Clostridium cylindrosporum DSM 605 TaxID=1121307 RepID=A0A0J8DCD6_CLOCY|nr:Na+/H+ antiporter [Clostridium cylindrosporum]KMT21969.1 sodium, potassium, lithium and rubidium/H(+) antiporter NhaK [Clostridium cylindrosporum DSM 605]